MGDTKGGTEMAKYCNACAGDRDELSYHSDEVYGNAQWALRYGATKESILSQILEARNLHEDSLSEDGWLIKANPEEQSKAGSTA
jgi:hypothetical protein